ncbi:hypothetical protein ULF88_03115 [Halopseudomonas pachastrellae]|nr:hypothetical protein [Halopseudomonas pachastrellae]
MIDSTLDDDLYDLRFYLQRCVRYHMRRSAFFFEVAARDVVCLAWCLGLQH